MFGISVFYRSKLCLYLLEMKSLDIVLDFKLSFAYFDETLIIDVF